MYKSGDYEIDNSLMLNDDDAEYLTWNPDAAGNRKTWTFSCWVKRGDVNVSAGGINHTLFTTVTGTDGIHIRAGSNTPYMQVNYGAGSEVVTNMVFRDPAAWYHIVVAVDTTQGTNTNRIKIYANGEQLTFSAATYPSQNADGEINTLGITHQIGRQAALTRYFDGYLAEINFIDGTALTPASFGETDSDYGHWKPKKYGGSYGTNGFYLNFKGSDRLLSATGGTITTDGDYKVHSFTSTGNTNFVVSSTTLDYGEADVLVVAGGGNGGYGASSVAGAGGGAGGMIYQKGYGITAGTHVVTVGAAATDSSFGSITAKAGGNAAFGNVGASGGSGAGRAGGGAGAAGIAGQGYAGGQGSGTVGVSVVAGGGGGGAGGVGGNAPGPAGGAGGAGLANSITGSSVTYATGGAGSYHNGPAGGSTTANLGNGGAGWGGGQNGGGSAGGTGIVIIRYKFQ